MVNCFQIHSPVNKHPSFGFNRTTNSKNIALLAQVVVYYFSFFLYEETMLSKNELDLITDTLANVYDWESENIERDFVALLKHEVPLLQDKKIEALFIAFDKLPAKERMSPDFDHHAFIKNHLAF